MFFDIYYLIIVMPFVLLSLYASFKVNTTFKKYDKVKTARGITGAETARLVLDANGLSHVGVQMVKGHLTDHYNPKDDTVYLSESVYSSTSAAACGVAAHEAGHAVQHAEEYLPAKVRMAIVSVTNIGSSAGIFLILIGLLFAGSALGVIAYVGIALFSLTTIFQLVTLPVEFNASRRAMAAISGSGAFTKEESVGARRVLTAAAMTYVAALAVSFAQLLRLLLIVGNANRRD